MAYATSDAGSDWQTWRVRRVASGTDLDDVVEWSKHSNASWRKDSSGFYYSAFDRPAPGSELIAQTGRRKALFHALGHPQSDDELVYEAPSEPEWEPWAEVSDDGRFLVISVTRGTGPETRTEIFELAGPSSPRAVLVPDFSCQAWVVANQGDTFFLVTDDQAERRRLVAVDLGRPNREDWREVVPEQAAVLTGALNCGGKLVCHYLEDACSRLSVYELDGALSHHVAVPPTSSVDAQVSGGGGVAGRPGSPLVHFGVQSFTDPGSIWSHNVGSGPNFATVTVATVRLGGRDDHRAGLCNGERRCPGPLFLTRRADLDRDGQARTLLYAYGGFDIPITPLSAGATPSSCFVGACWPRPASGAGASTAGRGTTPAG